MFVVILVLIFNRNEIMAAHSKIARSHDDNRGVPMVYMFSKTLFKILKVSYLKKELWYINIQRIG